MVDLIGNNSGSLSASGISFTGLASGLDTASIVAALVKLESQPIQQMQSQISKANSLNALYSKLKDKLTALQDKADALSTLSSGLSFSVSTSDDKVLAASVSGSALEGSHTIDVTQLAKAGRVLGGGKAGAIFTDAATTTIGTGNISITYGGTTTAVDVSGKTLNDAAKAINDAELGVTASVVNTGASGSPSYKLVVTGNETGAAHALTVAADAGVNVDFSALTTAQNAIVDVDGVTVQRDTNSVTDIVDGVTLDLKSLGSATITVAPDVDSVKSKINAFVAAYNDVVSFIRSNSQYDATAKVAGAFFNESTAKTIRNTLANTIIKSGTATGVSGTTPLAQDDGYSSLSMLGIKLQNDGTLLVDDAKLSDKLSANLGQAVDLFADVDGIGPDVGIASLIKEFAAGATNGSTLNGEAFDGLIQTKQAAIQKQIADLNERIADAQDHVNKFESSLNAKFSAFESIMAGLKNQQAALTATFGTI